MRWHDEKDWAAASAEGGTAEFFTKWHDPIREKQFPRFPIMLYDDGMNAVIVSFSDRRERQASSEARARIQGDPT